MTSTAPASAALASESRLPAAAPVNEGALRAQRDAALHAALLVDADLASLGASLRRVLDANVRLACPDLPDCAKGEDVFDSFSVTYEKSVGYGLLRFFLSFKAALRKRVPADAAVLFDGLPVANPAPCGATGLDAARLLCFDMHVPNAGVRFHVFELTLRQLRAASDVWCGLFETMVAESEAQLAANPHAPGAQVLRELAELERRHRELEAELGDVAARLSLARNAARDIRRTLEQQARNARHPVFEELMVLRRKAGLDDSSVPALRPERRAQPPV
jgi:hypothetical protein